MSIKKAIAGFMACVLMAMNLSAFCFAADTGMAGDTATESAVSAETSADSETEADTADTGIEAASDWLADMGITINLPDGIDIDENGNITFNISDFSWTVGGLSDTDSRDTASGDDTDGTETVEETALVGTVNCSYLNLREGPSTDYTILGCLKNGTEMEIVGEQDGWYEVVIPERTGYVYGGYLDVTEQVIEAASDDTGADEGEISDTELSDFEQQFLMMFLYMMMMNGMQSADTTDMSSALTPDGNLTLVDDYAENNEDGSGKQFITLITKAGNTFYLIIDRDDEGDENVHFLNLVDEADLLALMDEDEAAKYTAAEEPVPETPADTEEPAESEEPEEEESTAPVNLGPVLILLLAAVGAGGFFAYTKFFKGKKKQEQVKPDPDADYTDEDEEDFGLPDDEDFAELEDGDSDSEFDADDNEPV